ncbi:ganglioside GM2 activator-like [Lineus longissimus]|uniref:ganglioside GM2 activator-like n=1 Tax=Lineus longissimus TaxID=88925 RepID=UPI002B4C662E
MGRFGVVLMLSCLAVAVTAKSVEGPVRNRRSGEGFAWSDCGHDPNRPLRVTSLSMTPSPLTMPGELHVSFGGEVTRELGASLMMINIQRESGFSWLMRNVTVPCIRNIGSCTYPDTCNLIDRMIDEDWLYISRNVGQQIRQNLVDKGLNTACPLQPQQINIQDMAFQLPAIPRALSLFAGGTYHATVRFLGQANQKELGCIAMRIIVD